jgi:hypothetical protein
MVWIEGATLLEQLQRNLFIGRLLWGDEIQMSSLHRTIFYPQAFLKVVVA